MAAEQDVEPREGWCYKRAVAILQRLFFSGFNATSLFHEIFPFFNIYNKFYTTWGTCLK